MQTVDVVDGSHHGVYQTSHDIGRAFLMSNSDFNTGDPVSWASASRFHVCTYSIIWLVLSYHSSSLWITMQHNDTLMSLDSWRAPFDLRPTQCRKLLWASLNICSNESCVSWNDGSPATQAPVIFPAKFLNYNLMDGLRTCMPLQGNRLITVGPKRWHWKKYLLICSHFSWLRCRLVVFSPTAFMLSC